MKVAIIALGLLVLVAMAKSESCSMASDCQNLACVGMEQCQAGVCTCQEQNVHKCVTQNDCLSANMMHGHCRQDTIHCVDGHCRCTHH